MVLFQLVGWGLGGGDDAMEVGTVMPELRGRFDDFEDRRVGDR